MGYFRLLTKSTWVLMVSVLKRQSRGRRDTSEVRRASKIRRHQVGSRIVSRQDLRVEEILNGAAGNSDEDFW